MNKNAVPDSMPYPQSDKLAANPCVSVSLPSRWCLILVALTFLVSTVPAEFPVAGGNAQRAGFVDVEGPTDVPSVRWERPMGKGMISDTQPIIDCDGNIYATASPINSKLWKGPEAPEVLLISFTPQGVERWRYSYRWDHTLPAFQGTWSQLSCPVIVGDSIVIGHRFGVLRGLRRDTGALLWERDLSEGQQPITSTPVQDRAGAIYIDCRDIPVIHRIDAKTGTIEWSHCIVDGEIGNTSSPSISEDEKTLYIGRTTNQVPYLYAINTSDGTFKWAWSPESGMEHSFAWNVPVIDRDGTVYIQDEQLAHLYAIRDLGQIHERQWVLHRDGRDAPRFGAVSQQGYFGYYTDSRKDAPVLFHVDTTGREAWARDFSSGNTAGIILSRNALYFGMNGTGKIHALDLATGTSRWSMQVGTEHGTFSEGLSLDEDGTLYAGVDGTPTHPGQACLVALR